jgi:hypothetical protein
MQREWREASDLKPSRTGLMLVLAVAAGLRLWGIGNGIPYAVGVDEPEIVARVVTMMKTGDFNPHFFDYPGLYFYVQLLVAVLRFMAGAMDGAWTTLDRVEAADFYLWGRAVTAFIGTATVFLVHQAGLHWGARHALLAAGLMAVMPMHVRESHYVLTDVPMTFFVVLAFVLSLRAHEKGTLAAFAWAGAAAGLSAATKYNGAAALWLPLVAAWMAFGRDRPRLALALASLGGATLAFLIAAPYTVLDLPTFLNTFARLSTEYRPRHGAEAAWLVYLKHLQGTLLWPAALLAVAGLVMGIVRAINGPGQLRWSLAVSFSAIYFYVIATKGLVYGRYLLPILPFLSLLAAAAVVSGVSLLRRFEIPRAVRQTLIIGFTVAALLPPLVVSIQFDRRMARRSTQKVAFDWITVHIPRGSRILIEKYDLRLPAHRYRVEHVNDLIGRAPASYREAGFDYVIASSQVYGPVFEHPETAPVKYSAYQRLFAELPEATRVEPRPDRPGPELRVLKVKP